LLYADNYILRVDVPSGAAKTVNGCDRAFGGALDAWRMTGGGAARWLGANDWNAWNDGET